MAIISLPSAPDFASARFGLARGDQPLALLSGAEVIVVSRDVKWSASFALPALRGATARAWRVALGQLSSLTNTFQIVPPEYSGPSTGYAGAGPLVNGAGQLGTSLVCDGVTFSAAVLSAGDYLSVGGHLNMVTADATSSGAGAVTFSLARPLRSSPANNDPVEIFAPKVTLRLASPVADWALDHLLNHGMAFEAIEVLT